MLDAGKYNPVGLKGLLSTRNTAKRDIAKKSLHKMWGMGENKGWWICKWLLNEYDSIRFHSILDFRRQIELFILRRNLISERGQNLCILESVKDWTNKFFDGWKLLIKNHTIVNKIVSSRKIERIVIFTVYREKLGPYMKKYTEGPKPFSQLKHWLLTLGHWADWFW